MILEDLSARYELHRDEDVARKPTVALLLSLLVSRDKKEEPPLFNYKLMSL